MKTKKIVIKPTCRKWAKGSHLYVNNSIKKNEYS